MMGDNLAGGLKEGIPGKCRPYKSNMGCKYRI